MIKSIMAVDPGRAIGFAWRNDDGEIRTCTFTKPQDMWEALEAGHPDAVVVETFHRSGRIDEHMIHTMEVVGSVHGACHVLGVPVYRQLNQARRSFIPDAIELLKKQGRKIRMTKDEDEHEVAALAHLLCLEWRIKEGKL